MTNDHKPQTKTSLLVIGYWLLVIVPLSTHAYTFYRDLKLGDTGEDVRALQAALNADARTRVAESGPGSLGNETVVFGEKTRSAVVRYQNLYTDEILRPLGLGIGTGYVGASTRQHLSGTVGGSTIIEQNGRDETIKAFDAALGVSRIETNRSPVEDPRIPGTQEELFAAIEDFAGGEASDEELRDFGANMVLARYGYAPEDAQRNPDPGGGGRPGGGTPPQCSDRINNDANEDSLIDYPNDPGCASSRDNSERNTPQGGRDGGRGDADADSTGSGCIALLLDLLGL